MRLSSKWSVFNTTGLFVLILALRLLHFSLIMFPFICIAFSQNHSALVQLKYWIIGTTKMQVRYLLISHLISYAFVLTVRLFICSGSNIVISMIILILSGNSEICRERDTEREVSVKIPICANTVNGACLWVGLVRPGTWLRFVVDVHGKAYTRRMQMRLLSFHLPCVGERKRETARERESKIKQTDRRKPWGSAQLKMDTEERKSEKRGRVSKKITSVAGVNKQNQRTEEPSQHYGCDTAWANIGLFECVIQSFIQPVQLNPTNPQISYKYLHHKNAWHYVDVTQMATCFLHGVA